MTYTKAHRSMQRNKEPRNKPKHIWSINLHKGGKNIHGERAEPLINDVGKTEEPHAQKMSLDHNFTPYAKHNSRLIKDLSIRPETVKVLKQNIDGRLLDVEFDSKSKGNKSKLKSGTTSG